MLPVKNIEHHVITKTSVRIFRCWELLTELTVIEKASSPTGSLTQAGTVWHVMSCHGMALAWHTVWQWHVIVIHIHDTRDFNGRDLDRFWSWGGESSERTMGTWNLSPPSTASAGTIFGRSIQRGVQIYFLLRILIWNPNVCQKISIMFNMWGLTSICMRLQPYGKHIE